MRALVQEGYRGRASLSVVDLPEPQPGPGEVKVRVLACGANASDWEYATGRPAYARIHGAMRPRPRVLGSDVLGQVVAVGAGVTLAPGTRVLADTMGSFGGFADFCLAKADRWVAVPEGLSDVDGAALPQSGTIAHQAMQGNVRPGMRVLVNGGGGGTGPLAIQLARAAGAHVTGVDNAAKAEVMRAAGADAVLDYRTTDFTRVGQWDLILDLCGTRGARAARRALRPGGSYRSVGGPMGVLLGVAVLGGLVSLVSDRKVGVLAADQGPGRLAGLMALVQAGTLRPMIGAVVPLEAAPDALARMGAGEISGKLVVRPG